jgi:hypothetical protein
VTDWAWPATPIPSLIALRSEQRRLPAVAERCGYRFIDERALASHLTGETNRFPLIPRSGAAREPLI